MAEAKDGSRVRLHYTGTLKDGTQFDSSKGRDPLEFEVGAGQVIPGFDDAVRGLSAGDTKTFQVAPAEAYGERREELVGEIDNDQLPDGMTVAVGQQLEMAQPDGESMVVNVTAVGEESFTVDANHPLAGQALIFEIEVVEVAGPSA